MKKRNKAYKPRPVRVPAIIPLEMVGDALPMLALQLHAGIVTLIEAPTVDHCNNLSRQLCIIAGAMSHQNTGAPILEKRDASSLAIRSAILAIESVVDRHGRTGKVAVTDSEAVTLRAAAGKLDDALSDISLFAYRKAEAEVTKYVGY